MPFITEELWHALSSRDHELIVAKWPQADARALDETASFFVNWQIEIITAVRGLRADLGIPWTATLNPIVIGCDPGLTELLQDGRETFARLAKIGSPTTQDTVPANSAQIVVRDATLAFALEGVIDLAAERARLAKAVAAAEKERDALAGRLGNASFIERAKPDAVAKARADHADKAAEAERLKAALGRLG